MDNGRSAKVTEQYDRWRSRTWKGHQGYEIFNQLKDASMKACESDIWQVIKETHMVSVNLKKEIINIMLHHNTENRW